MNYARRQELLAVLRSRYPWVDAPDCGPAAVEAGECDRCCAEARLIETCGPGVHQYLGRRCAAHLGESAWCDGHGNQASEILAWLARLPDEADTVARLWWVATGEVGVDRSATADLERLELPAP